MIQPKMPKMAPRNPSVSLLDGKNAPTTGSADALEKACYTIHQKQIETIIVQITQ